MDFVWIAIGVVGLYAGGEALVAGARGLAVGLGVRPVVIGLTVVALGTSMPELAATLTAAFEGRPEIAFGNVVGSNIANLALVLGLASVIAPLVVEARFLVREVPFMLGTSVLMMALVWDGRLGRWEGLLLLSALVLFLLVLLRGEREGRAVAEEFSTRYADDRDRGVSFRVGQIVVGIVLLSLGAKALITGAVGLARQFGIEERVIGLTLVAFGTSLPEVVSTLVAAVRRESEIIVGNLIGSNIFNVLFILGTTVMVRPITVDVATAEIDLAVMLGVSFLVWPLMLYGRRLSRVDGAILLVVYTAYVAWLFLRA